jgi:C-terminal processing protease CtpA/Prc
MQKPVGAIVLSLILGALSLSLTAQQKTSKLDHIDAERLHVMLREANSEVKKNYYDPTFHGFDLESRYHEYDAKLNSVTTLGEGFRIVAAFLTGFHDSHLFFMPPPRAVSFDSGYRFQMFGDRCFITRVRPGTDAALKVHPGDEIIHFNGFDVTRTDLWEIQYYFRTLAPAAVETVDIKTPDGTKMTTRVKSAIRPLKRSLDIRNSTDIGDMIDQQEDRDELTRERWVETEGALFWKMAQFQADDTLLNGMLDSARHHPALVLDLRGNPGGSVLTLQWLLGHFFDHDVNIGQRVGRKEMKPQVARAVKNPYTGKLIVLVDSKSASAAEVFARVIQLEHRGTVIGDTTEGAVMEAHHYTESSGAESVILYGFSVTDANLIMADGKSLEGTGVTPDEKILPTADDLAAGRDPVLSRAAELAGSKVDPEAAGKLFPYEWPKI